LTTDHDGRSRIVVSWLREDAHENAERVLLEALNEIDHTRQRRSWWPAWRFADMNTFAKVLVATAAVVVVAVVGINLLPGGSGPGGSPPSPSPSPTAEPTATPRPTSADVGLPVGPFHLEDKGLAMTVTIPASGWTFLSEGTALMKGDEVANLPEAAILFWSFPAGTPFYVYADPCRLTSTKPATPVTAAGDIAAGLAAQASRDASEPVDVTVGGKAGQSVTLHVPDDAVPDACEGGEFASYGVPGDEPTRYHQGPGQIDEFWILDVDGAIVIIDAMYRPNTPAELVDELRTIVESTTFETP
jgi:hypothetical protein